MGAATTRRPLRSRNTPGAGFEVGRGIGVETYQGGGGSQDSRTGATRSALVRDGRPGDIHARRRDVNLVLSRGVRPRISIWSREFTRAPSSGALGELQNAQQTA